MFMELLLFVFICVPVSLLAGMVIYKILCMYIDREISDYGCLAYFFAVGACVVYIILTKNIFTSLLLVFGACTYFYIVCYLRYKHTKEMTNDFYIKKLLAYEEQITRDPTDWGTKSLMAEIHFKLGNYPKAVELQHEVVGMRGDFTSESQKLKTYEKYLDEEENPKDMCWHCGKKSLRSKGKCDNCGQPLGISRSLFDWLRTDGLKELRASTVFLVLITMALFIFNILPSMMRLMVLAGIYLVVVAFLVYSYFKK